MQIDKHHNISKRVGSSVSSPRHLFPALLCWPLRVTCPVLPLPSGLQLGSAPQEALAGGDRQEESPFTPGIYSVCTLAAGLWLNSSTKATAPTGGRGGWPFLALEHPEIQEQPPPNDKTKTF